MLAKTALVSRLGTAATIKRVSLLTRNLCSVKPERSEHEETPQVKVPDLQTELNELKTLEFRGLETQFPCLSRIQTSGPEPEYDKIVSGYQTYQLRSPFYLKYNQGVIPELRLAYETWGQLNHNKDNAIMINAGLSASSHARSHKANQSAGWWEKFVGPGCAVDTDKFFVICTNNLGGCYGSSGPSTINPKTGKPYGTTFPMICVEDIVKAQFLLLDHLGIDKLYASVGSSLGGMTSLMAAALFPERVGRVASISSCAQSHPSSVAMRYLQRRCIMTDPHWNHGHYYGTSYPLIGMKLAREIATMSYRSGPEWEERFGRKRIEGEEDSPSLCPNFLIESYLEKQGESFCNKFDPNSLLYISKAMDLFDMSEGFDSLAEGVSRVQCPTMVIGVQTDILFPIWQQKELARLLKETGNDTVTYYELNSIYGHDTFLLDLSTVGAAVKGHLETEQRETSLARHKRDRSRKSTALSYWARWKSAADTYYDLKGPRAAPTDRLPAPVEDSRNSEGFRQRWNSQRDSFYDLNGPKQWLVQDKPLNKDLPAFQEWSKKDDYYMIKGPKN